VTAPTANKGQSRERPSVSVVLIATLGQGQQNVTLRQMRWLGRPASGAWLQAYVLFVNLMIDCGYGFFIF
jgi:hypothetical protein